LSRILSNPGGDTLPQILDISIEAFRKHRGDWLLWRNLGHFEQSGAWVAPVSFTEAYSMPKEMLDVFFELDGLLAKMQKQLAKKHGK
jgi:hypothetical protein